MSTPYPRPDYQHGSAARALPEPLPHGPRRGRPSLTPAERWELLRPLAAGGLALSALSLLAVIYLTAFAQLTAHGTRIGELDRKIATAEAELQRSRGEIARLTRRERVEREAPRLGLIQLPAGEVDDAVRTSERPVYQPVPRQVAAIDGRGRW